MAFFSAYLSCPNLCWGGKVPALYVFGDSQSDIGNNNYLETPIRANFPHNGVDYPGHLATGRFSNGQNLADFIAGSLSVATPPAYRSIGNTTGNSSIFLNGVNFASGGAGVLKLTSKGLTISFDEQIKRDYSIVHAGLVQQLGKAQASTHTEGSIFAIGVGGNDIASRISLDDPTPIDEHQQLLTSSGSDHQFIDSLAHSLKRQLQRLYELGMRKLFFVGTGPLGCYPLLRQQSVTKECNAEANSLSMQYNTAVQNLLGEMSTRHPDFRYSFLDQYAALQQYINEPQANGFAEVEAACCALGDNNAMVICTPESQLCSNRTNHIFWDGAHLTEVTTQKLIAVAFNGSAPLVAPVNLRQLIAP